MKANRTMRLGALAPLLAMGVAMLAEARADLYWCQHEPNRAALVQEKIDGVECRLVAKDEPDPPQDEREQPQNAPDPRSQAPAEQAMRQERERPALRTDRSFPRVSESDQLKRDQTRLFILRAELNDETESFRHLRTLLDGQDLVSSDPEARQFYMVRLKRHAQNIKAIRQEIARLQ